MRKLAYALGAAALVTLALVAALLRGPGPSSANASSHREAPLISEDPSADNTDLYAFRSPDKPDTLTIVSNFIPGEDPAAGPNYYTFSPTARYDIYVDRNGDGKPDVSYYFQFQRKYGPFFLGDTVQPYTVTRVANGKSTVIAHGTTPPDNIGPRTTPNYHAARDEGSDAARRAAARCSPASVTIRSSRTSATSSTCSRSARARATRAAARTSSPATPSTRSRCRSRSRSSTRPRTPSASGRRPIGRKATRERQAGDRGKWVQVSRLGNPLINEVVIPTALKDHWNRTSPSQDAQFVKYYKTPILAAVINKLYNLGAPETNRDDLVQVLLTGIPNVTFTGQHAGRRAADQPVGAGHARGQGLAARRARRRQPGLAERPAPERRRGRHRRAGCRRLPPRHEAAARRRRRRGRHDTRWARSPTSPTR